MSKSNTSNAATIRTTYRALAEISRKSPGYGVMIIEGFKSFPTHNIRFAQSAAGRINRAVVEVDYLDSTGKLCAGRFNSDDCVSIMD